MSIINVYFSFLLLLSYFVASDFFGAFFSGVQMLHFLLDFWVFGLQERIFESRLPDFVEEIIPELEVAAFLHEFDSVSGYALFVLVGGVFECEELDLHVEIAVLFVLLGRQTEVLLLKVGFDVESRVEAIDVVLAELLPDEAWFALDVKVGHVVELEGVEGSGGSLSDELEEILVASFDFLFSRGTGGARLGSLLFELVEDVLSGEFHGEGLLHPWVVLELLNGWSFLALVAEASEDQVLELF